MKTVLLKNSLIAAFALSSGLMIAQSGRMSVDQAIKKVDAEVIKSQMSVKELVRPVSLPVQKSVTAVPQAGYQLPEETNFVSFYMPVNDESHPLHPFRENGIYYTLPANITVTYVDASANEPDEYNWTIPGGNPATTTDQDAEVVYGTAGTYLAPTLTVKNGDGETSFTVAAAFDPTSSDPDYTRVDHKRVKVGGTVDIWNHSVIGNDDYFVYYYGDEERNSYLFGSNKGDESIIAAGEVFFVAQKSTLKAVSVYVANNPSASDMNHKVKVEILPVNFAPDGESFEWGTPLTTQEFAIKDMIAEAGPETGYRVGLGYITLDNPVEVEGNFYVRFSNWPNAVGDNFGFLLDTQGTGVSFMTAMSNGGEYFEYFRPNAVFGDAGDLNITFMIGATITYGGGNSIELVSGSKTVNRAYFVGNDLMLNYQDAQQVVVYNMVGQPVYQANLEGKGEIQVPFTGNGAYIVKFIGVSGNVETVKILK